MNQKVGYAQCKLFANREIESVYIEIDVDIQSGDYTAFEECARVLKFLQKNPFYARKASRLGAYWHSAPTDHDFRKKSVVLVGHHSIMEDSRDPHTPQDPYPQKV